MRSLTEVVLRVENYLKLYHVPDDIILRGIRSVDKSNDSLADFSLSLLDTLEDTYFVAFSVDKGGIELVGYTSLIGFKDNRVVCVHTNHGYLLYQKAIS